MEKRIVTESMPVWAKVRTKASTVREMTWEMSLYIASLEDTLMALPIQGLKMRAQHPSQLPYARTP